MKSFLRKNALSLVLLILLIVSVCYIIKTKNDFYILTDSSIDGTYMSVSEKLNDNTYLVFSTEGNVYRYKQYGHCESGTYEINDEIVTMHWEDAAEAEAAAYVNRKIYCSGGSVSQMTVFDKVGDEHVFMNTDAPEVFEESSK